MRYISDDGKVFNTEQECLEYENTVNAERIKQEKLKKEQEERYNKIQEHYKELVSEIEAYQNDYKVKTPTEMYLESLSKIFSELLN